MSPGNATARTAGVFARPWRSEGYGIVYLEATARPPDLPPFSVGALTGPGARLIRL